MLSMLKNWKGTVEINGALYNTVQEATNDFKHSNNQIHIKLYPQTKKAENEAGNNVVTEDKVEYKITVKKYMTEKASPTFDFMAKWNNDNPMPMRTMVGYVEKETKGMQYWHLHGQAEKEVKCLRCGKTLTNEMSKKYGIGPECITKIPVLMNLDVSDVDNIKNKMHEIEWSGWVIKSSIVNCDKI